MAVDFSHNAIHPRKPCVLDCSICLEEFQLEGEKIPRIIPSCGHSFCEGCISAFIKNECPTCSTRFPRSYRGNVRDLPKNYQLIEQIGIAQVSYQETQHSEESKKDNVNHAGNETSLLPVQPKLARISDGLQLSENKLHLSLNDSRYFCFCAAFSNHNLVHNENGSVSYTCTLHANATSRFFLGWCTREMMLNDIFQLKNVDTLHFSHSKMELCIDMPSIKEDLMCQHYESYHDRIVMSTYDKAQGSIHFKVTSNNKVILDQICFREVRPQEEMYCCVIIRRHCPFNFNNIITFDLPFAN